MKNPNPRRKPRTISLTSLPPRSRVGLGWIVRNEQLEAIEVDIKSVEEGVLKLLQEVAG